MGVREEYEMECPKCKRDNGIVIYARQTIEVLLITDGTTDWGHGADTEWEDSSLAKCTYCDYEGRVKDFHIVTEEAKERQLENNWRYQVQCCYTKLGFEAWKEHNKDWKSLDPQPDPETPANSQPGASDWYITGAGHAFWSTEKGWVSNKSDATFFRADEMDDVDFPTDGLWVKGMVKEEPTEYMGWPQFPAGVGKSSVIYAGNDPKDGAGIPEGSIPMALFNNILWHLENCASEPDGGGAAYMAQELRKLIGKD